MAFDYRRLIGAGKKSGRIFGVRQVYFTKSCQQMWVRVNQPFIPFIHHIWGETVLWGTVFIIQTSDRMQHFTILQYKLHSFNIQDDRSMRGLLTRLQSTSFLGHVVGERGALEASVYRMWEIFWHPVAHVQKIYLILFMLRNDFVLKAPLGTRTRDLYRGRGCSVKWLRATWTLITLLSTL